MRVPTKEEIKQALKIPKVTPPLDKLGRTNRATTSKSMMLKIREKSPVK
jgi:hypothetical protein